MLTDSQIERYSRQIILPEVGGKGQEKLLRARVLVNGSGPLQTAALFYLAAAGVGTIGVLAHTTPPLLAALVPEYAAYEDATTQGLTRLNPDCTVVLHKLEDARHPELLVQQYDLVLSPPDPLHDACYRSHRPFVCAQIATAEAWLCSCRGYEADQPCLHCFPTLPSTREKEHFSPDLHLAALFVGTIQTTEALKILLGLHQASTGKLLRYQFPTLRFSESIVPKNPACPLCREPNP
jgi:adenylyltransferase/sulfurtransferase